MTYTPIDKGTPNWDVPVNAAFTAQDNRITSLETDVADLENYSGFQANDVGFLTWNFDPGSSIIGQSGFTVGTVHMFRMELKQQSTVNSISIGIQTAASGLTVGQNFGGIYDSAGNRLAITVDTSTLWTNLGVVAMPLSAPIPLAPGTYYVAMLANGATPPSVSRSFGATTVGPVANAGTTVTNARWANGPTGQTSLPSSINMSTRTYGPTGWWVAIS